MISREALEKNQISLYVFVLLLAGAIGLFAPDIGTRLDITLSFVIALLMYSMF